MKKLLSLVLCTVMILSLFTIIPFSASAEKADIASVSASSGTTGDCTWTLDDNGVLTISGEGKMTDYDYWFTGVAPWGTDISEVIIEKGVTRIGDRAFLRCSNLTSVTIGASVTSISNGAFNHCTGLKSIKVNSDNTVYDSRNNCNAIIETKSDNLIMGCMNTVIPDSVTSIGDSAFSDCEGLTSVNIPDSVTSIGEDAFAECTGLTSVIIGNSVDVIGDDAFFDCTGLTNVTIGDSVTSIGDGAFFGCPSLTSVTIPDSVTVLGEESYAFGYVYNDDTEKVENFTIYGHIGTAAETYANENGFTFIELTESVEYTDELSGISVETEDGLELSVVNDTAEKAGLYSVKLDNETVSAVYDITLKKDDQEIQPDGDITVKIPSEDKNAKVYRVEEDGSLTDMNAVYEEGFLVFTTSHLSIYILASENTVVFGDADGDGELSVSDVSFVQRFVSGLISNLASEKAADIDGDGEVTITDASLMQRYIAGFNIPYDIG